MTTASLMLTPFGSYRSVAFSFRPRLASLSKGSDPMVSGRNIPSSARLPTGMNVTNRSAASKRAEARDSLEGILFCLPLFVNLETGVCLQAILAEKESRQKAVSSWQHTEAEGRTSITVMTSSLDIPKLPLYYFMESELYTA